MNNWCVCVCASAYCAHCRGSRPVNKKNKNHYHQNHNHKGKRRFCLPPRRIFFSPASPLHFFFGSFLAFRSFRSTNYWKNIVFRDFLIFLRSWFFYRFILFYLFLFFDSSYFCFLFIHILGNLIFKFPAINKIIKTK